MARRLIIVCLVLNAALLAGRFWQELPSAAAGVDGGASESGDVNGDGTRDISDPIYLLTWLFSGGPEPVACAQGGADLESRVELLEAVVAGCLDIPDRNENGLPDCAEPPFCGNARCDEGETVENCDDCREDADADGARTPEDCDDTDPSVFPGAQEICDLKDNDCNGSVDDDVFLPATCYECRDGRILALPFGVPCPEGGGICEGTGVCLPW